MAGNSAKVFVFIHGDTRIKAVLVEEAPDEGAFCCLCKDPLHGSPFYTTEPRTFDVHLRCAENYCNFFIHGHGHGQEKSSSPAPANHDHYKHDKQPAGFQYPSQLPQHNVYGNVYIPQPMNFSYRPAPFYHQYPYNYYQQQPPNPWQPQQQVYGNAYHAQPMNFSYRPPPFYHQYPSYCYGQPPNPSFPVPPTFSQSYSYRPPAYDSGSGNNEASRPTKWATSAAVMIGSSALSAFLQVLFGMILAI